MVCKTVDVWKECGGEEDTGVAIPLAGTAVGKPITGTLEYDAPLAGGTWEQIHGPYFSGANTLGFFGLGVSASFVIATRTDLGALRQFAFLPDGTLLLPTTPDVTSDDKAAATKEFVLAQIPGTGGQDNTQSNVGGGAAVGMTKVGIDLPLRTLVTDPNNNLVITENADTIDISLAPIPTFFFPPTAAVDAAAGDELIRLSQALLSFALVTRNIVAGTGLTGGGTLSGDVSLAIDPFVVMGVAGNQTISGTKTFNGRLVYTTQSGNPFDVSEVADVQYVNDVFASDISKKKDVVLTTTGLRAVNQLKPVDFTWEEGTHWAGSRAVGNIAQDVQKVIPNAVHTAADGTLMLDPLAMIGVLVKAVQELSAEVDALKASS